MTGPAEFPRPVRLDQIGDGARVIAVEADADERAAVARRFDLIGIDRLSAQFTLRRTAAGIEAKGTVSAAVVQPCVATAEPVPATIEEQVTLRFQPEPAATADEVELDDDEVDTIFYAGGAIDLGEAAAQTMALALDPFPRSPAADQTLRRAGVLDESAVEPAAPTGGLAGLRDLLGGAGKD